MKLFSVLVISILFSSGVVNETNNGTDDPEHSISDVMKKGHMGKDGLLGKIKKGEATDEEKVQLLDMYIDMLAHDPPKGEKEDWEKTNQAIILAAAKVVVGREGAGEALVEATNCKACHDAHK